MISRRLIFASCILAALFAGAIAQWHRLDTRPSSLDETKHMQLAMDYRDWVAHGVPLTNEWAHVYPPIYHFSIIPALSAGIPSECKAALMHTAYLFILIMGCVLLCRAQGRPDAEGILAALVVIGYAYVQWVTRRALTDFPLLSWTTLSVALLARTQGFSNRRDSLLWGVSAGIGLLFKPPFTFFIIGPLVWTYLTSQESQKTKHLIMALGVALGVGLPWYFWNSVNFLDKAGGLVREKTGEGVDPHTLRGWLFYLRILPHQIGVGSLLFSVLGLGCLIAQRKQTQGIGLLVAWILGAYLILSFIINKDPRHSLPFLPALALLAVRGWTLVLPPRWGYGSLAVAGLFLMTQNLMGYDRPVRENWQHYAIGSVMAKNHDPSFPFISASVMAQNERFFARSLKWSLRQEGIAMKSVSAGDSDTSFAEYLVTRSGPQDQETGKILAEWNALKPGTRAFNELYVKVGDFPLADGTVAYVYHRQAHLKYQIDGLTPAALAARLQQALRQWWVESPLEVTVEATPDQLREGRPESVQITVPHITLVLRRPRFNLYRLWDESRLGLLGFDAMEPSLEIDAREFERRLRDVKGLESPEVHFTDGGVVVSARFRGIPVRARARVEFSPGRYPMASAVLESLSVAHVPLPAFILGKARRQILPLYPIPDFPGAISIHHITLRDDRLTIS